MSTNKSLLLLRVETALHAGSGDGFGLVDLPIQRERHTAFPKIEASSLKGALKEHFTRLSDKKGEDKKVNAIFGKGNEDDAGKTQAGALSITDARILFFPVKSMEGVFVWITSELCLRRLKQDIEQYTGNSIRLNINSLDRGKALRIKSTNDTESRSLLKKNKLVLEDYAFDVVNSANSVVDYDSVIKPFFKGSIWEEKSKKDIYVLNDDDFRDFLELSTEVITRIAIDPATGVVKDGALFTEEYLPTETVLYSALIAHKELKEEKEDKKSPMSKEDILTTFKDEMSGTLFQLGANASLGKGLLYASFMSSTIPEETKS